MEKLLYKEMVENLDLLFSRNIIQSKKIFLFGHCQATEKLADLLLGKGLKVMAILDNNAAKYGTRYRGIEIRPPFVIMREQPSQVLVCIVARAYAAMADQLKRMGYTGVICKLVDYNSYAEYSLSQDTLERKRQRVERGIELLQKLKKRYPDAFQILCPFSALGDIYFMRAYLPHFLRNRGIKKYVVNVVGKACAEVVGLFDTDEVGIYAQKDMDEMIQGALYTKDMETFIPHQDRPYVVNLSKALYVKQIPLERLYCCGVYGLPVHTKPYRPIRLRKYRALQQIKEGKSVILSPYAKSVTELKQEVWNQIVDDYSRRGYDCYTNVVGEEIPLPDTKPISPAISEIQSVVERAGTFIGIRSGLCDVLREASCRKVALYPNYNYCDTRWKAIEMYGIENWENIVVGECCQWKIS